MSDLTWTDEPPSEPGVYLVYHILTGDVMSFRVYDDGCAEPTVHSADWTSHVDSMDAVSKWAGPIPEPTDSE